MKVRTPEKALPVAVAAVFSTRGILLIRRDKPPFAGLWGMPGGKVHYGEHLDEAVLREVSEETGLKATFSSLRGVVTELLYDGDRLAMHYMLLVCRLFSRSVRVRKSEEGEVRWFPLGYLERNQHLVIPSDWLMLKKLVLRRPRKNYYRCVVRRTRGHYEVTRFE